MKNLTCIVLLAISFLQCNKDKYTIATGVESGTYNQFGKSLEVIPDIKLKIISTHGSQENIEDVRDGKADVAFTQIDNFENLSMTDKEIQREVKIVLPLYSEELHLLTSNRIASLDDLKGKTISIGPKKSGMEGTAWSFFTIMNLDASAFKIRQGSSASALTALENGEIDALFIVAGAPMRLLSSLIPKRAKKIKIFSFSNRQVLQLLDSAYQYHKATIGKKVYAWNQKEIRTISVDSIIIASSDTDKAFVKKLLKGIFKNKQTLMKAHSKWAEVSMAKIRDFVRRLPGQMHPGTLEFLNEQ